jgi:hypothetical protein
VKTFAIGFNEPEYDELPYARQVAERFGTEHHELVVRPDAAAILPKLELLDTWSRAVRDRALALLQSGGSVPGWKVVEGRSNRRWANPDRALGDLIARGLDRIAITDEKPRGLAVVEKEAKRVQVDISDLLIKPAGKPTLAPADDARGTYDVAERFAKE